MHDRNPYKTPIDFFSLSQHYPRLKHFLTNLTGGGGEGWTIDFRNVEAQRCLTEALLWRDFQLKISLPEDRLCPPVPNRLNYVLWIQDVLSESFLSLEKSPEVIGIDIGTGASAIYPLLGCKVDPTWSFIGTEIDSVSSASAEKNVEQNHLAHRIRISKASSPGLILTPFQVEPDKSFAFTMCNPPFYANTKDIERSAEGKALEPNSVCTGAEVEMITPGGEESFVLRMFMESTRNDVKDRCLWFTSMLGKFSSIKKVVDVLRKHNVNNYALTELVQGQTRRWVVAWSFSDLRVPDNLARNLPSAHHALLPPHNNCEKALHNSDSVCLAELREDLMSILAALGGVDVVTDPNKGEEVATNGSTGNCNQEAVNNDEAGISVRVSAMDNTWSRAARRAGKTNHTSTPGKQVIMVVDIYTVRKRLEVGELWVLMGVWRRGRERGVFESFWNHVSRKVGSAVEGRVPRAVQP